MIRVTLALFLSCGLANGLRAQDDPPADEQEQAEDRLAFMKEQPKVYLFQRGANSAELQLEEEPVLRWDNPISGVKDGTVFIWTHNGRPEVAAQVFLARGEIWLHEFQSLSLDSLEGQRDDTVFWHPKMGVTEPQLLSDAPRPAGTSAGRLLQMRSLARTFSAAVDFRVSSGNEREHFELRMLRTPLHRYGAADSEILDGALFAFVQGTNPEVLLMIEARAADDGYRWTYCLAPMTGYRVEASRGGKSIWSVPEQKPGSRDPSGAYWIHRHES